MVCALVGLLSNCAERPVKAGKQWVGCYFHTAEQRPYVRSLSKYYQREPSFYGHFACHEFHIQYYRTYSAVLLSRLLAGRGHKTRRRWLVGLSPHPNGPDLNFAHRIYRISVPLVFFAAACLVLAYGVITCHDVAQVAHRVRQSSR